MTSSFNIDLDNSPFPIITNAVKRRFRCFHTPSGSLLNCSRQKMIKANCQMSNIRLDIFISEGIVSPKGPQAHGEHQHSPRDEHCLMR